MTWFGFRISLLGTSSFLLVWPVLFPEPAVCLFPLQHPSCKVMQKTVGEFKLHFWVQIIIQTWNAAQALMLRLWRPTVQALWCYLIFSLFTQFKFEIFFTDLLRFLLQGVPTMKWHFFEQFGLWGKKCGLPLVKEWKKRKTFFSHTAGSMGLSERGSSGHMAFQSSVVFVAFCHCLTCPAYPPSMCILGCRISSSALVPVILVC